MSEEEAAKFFAEAESAYESEDLERAIFLFKRLAENGHPEACRNLGFIFKTGDGVPVDFAASRFWYSRYLMGLRRRAEFGDPEATFMLGKLYQYGDIVSVNFEKALQFFRRAAEQGYTEAVFHLAVLYRYGWCGVQQDESEFLCWLDHACEQLHPEALYTKGLLLVADDVNLAEDYIGKAARLGFWPAVEYEENKRA
jgi:TPR repeat protein